ncbi:hypothetical protein KA529_03185 [Candidatus Saccharibacteria bacterium]|nr:hypothetical protein [Candidatus Saccharibacteria bacterium]
MAKAVAKTTHCVLTVIESSLYSIQKDKNTLSVARSPERLGVGLSFVA